MASPQPSPRPASPTTLMLLAAAFPVHTLIISVAVGLPSAKRSVPLEGTDFILAGVAIVSAVASVILAGQKLAVRETVGDETPQKPIAQFQTDMLICLAFAELSALLGIFVVLPQDASAGWTLVAASLGAQLLGVLPHILAYVRSQKS